MAPRSAATVTWMSRQRSTASGRGRGPALRRAARMMSAIAAAVAVTVSSALLMPAVSVVDAARATTRPTASSTVGSAGSSIEGSAQGQTSGRSLPLGKGEARFIVRTDGTAALDRVQARLGALGVNQLDRWQHALTALLVQATPARAAALASLPGVVSVESTVPVSVEDTQYSPPNWGLDRVDQRTALDPVVSSFGYPTTGAGVTAYVIDTGVRMTHSQFAGRIDPAQSYYYPFPSSRSCAAATSANDLQGHGTHVAGVLAGATAGVAKGARVVPVRVLDCVGNGEDSTVIAGIDWVIAHHAAGVPAVANLSLGGPASSALDAAVAALQADGITVVVAAGNQSVDSCTRSPARVTRVITVAAIDRTDASASYSNYGKCNDLFAPGTQVRSAWYGDDSGLVYMTGTSMASPFVAGAAALLLQRSPSLTPAQVWASLDASSTKGVVAEKSGDPDKLLYVEQFVAVSPWADAFNPFDSPLRMVDTRAGSRGVWEAVDQSKRFAAGEVRRFSTALVMPANASLVLNIVTVDPLAMGHIRVYPCASTTSPKPTVSFLNYRAGANVGNEGIIGVGTAGGICVYAVSAVHLVIDAVGWFPQGVTFSSLAAPVRLFDTRATTTGTNNRGVLEVSVDESTPFAAGEVRRYSPLGAGGGQVPASGVAALAVNVAAVAPTAGGELRVFPCDAVTDRPASESVSTAFVAGTTVTVGAVATLSASGAFCVQASAATDVVVDATGRLGAGAKFAVLPSPGHPIRLLDTRVGVQGAAESFDVAWPLPGATSGATLLSFAGVGGVPSAPGLRALVLTVTARGPAARGNLKMWACSTTDSMAPSTAVLSYSVGVDMSNLVVVPVSADTGGVCVRASSSVDVTIDVSSWFVSVPA